MVVIYAFIYYLFWKKSEIYYPFKIYFAFVNVMLLIFRRYFGLKKKCYFYFNVNITLKKSDCFCHSIVVTLALGLRLRLRWKQGSKLHINLRLGETKTLVPKWEWTCFENPRKEFLKASSCNHNLGVGFPKESQFFKARFVWANIVQIKSSLGHWKCIGKG
jgi:hypothetical protein